MDSRVDHEPDRAPHLVSELSELRVRIPVESELGAEALGVETPALDEGGVAAVATEFRNSLELLSDRNLKVMARH